MPRRRSIALAILSILAAWTPGATAAAPGASAVIPDLFDPHHRPPKPDLASIKRIRFLTTDDFPPFHFALPDGTLSGFDIDLARAICADLAIACTIQARPFTSLVAKITAGEDDALIAAVADTPATRADLAFTAPYYTTPGRFAARSTDALAPATPEALAGRSVGVVAGTAYEAYLRTFFPRSATKSFADRAALQAALRTGTLDAAFGDAIALSIWLNAKESASCCAFRGGPFTESHYFGNGVSIAVGKADVQLRLALNYELAKMSETGVVADLYLKYFPIGFY